ncbi:hypothetical protein Q8A67_003563 [Cirrhinus molitorella]|uniref:Uncharacterized protein n=1 Tax=Cirrhinus molitorella TaxID=172907 RepID=A0AA88TVB2_9TELE|nr:hypothetical protein Q8A67_003563 [Cirrhinus molitorella]
MVMENPLLATAPGAQLFRLWRTRVGDVGLALLKKDLEIDIQSYGEPSNPRERGIPQLPFDGLQCYGCNVFHGQKYVDVGCTNPEVITCTHSHKGFKHRFCIKTESTALGIVLTSGCATSRHCQQQELPGVSIHCCDSDLCNSATRRPAHSLQRALLLLILARMCL